MKCDNSSFILCTFTNSFCTYLFVSTTDPAFTVLAPSQTHRVHNICTLWSKWEYPITSFNLWNVIQLELMFTYRQIAIVFEFHNYTKLRSNIGIRTQFVAWFKNIGYLSGILNGYAIHAYVDFDIKYRAPNSIIEVYAWLSYQTSILMKICLHKLTTSIQIPST